jgi:hypothetical protein
VFIAKFGVGSVLIPQNLTDVVTWEIWGSHGYVVDDDDDDDDDDDYYDDDAGVLIFDDVYIGI